MSSESDNSGSDSDVPIRKRAKIQESEEDDSSTSRPESPDEDTPIKKSSKDDSDSSSSEDENNDKSGASSPASSSSSRSSASSNKRSARNSDNEDEVQREPQNKDSDDDSEKSDQEQTAKSSISAKSDDDSDGDIVRKKSKTIISSDEEEAAASSPIKKTINSDSEEEDLVKKSERNNFKDIFGEISSEDEEDEEALAAKRREQDEEEQRREINEFLDAEEASEEPIPETRIDVTIPRITADLGNDIHFIKLPNFLSVDTHPYNPQWYEDEIDEDEVCDEEGRARMKLKVENTIRWRQTLDKDNNLTKESNARVVKWSDGSMSLHLGSEIFDIHKQQLLQGDNNHLYIRQGTGLQGQAVFKTKLTFRPHSTDSFTHKKMTLSLADRSQKTQKIRVLANVGKNPEADRWEKIKKEEEKLRAAIKRENKVNRTREKANQRGPTSSYLEPDGYEDDDEGGISLSAIKNKYKKGNYSNVYSDSGSDSGDSMIFDKKKNSTVKKSARIEESDED